MERKENSKKQKTKDSDTKRCRVRKADVIVAEYKGPKFFFNYLVLTTMN